MFLRRFFAVSVISRRASSNIATLQNQPGTQMAPKSAGLFFEGIAENQRRFSKHLLMARVGDFYEFYGEQAETVARAVGFKLATTSYQRREMKFCGFPSYKMKDYVRLLMDSGFTIAKYEQYEKLQANDQKVITRRVDRIFTPGTVVEEDIVSEDSERFILALCQRDSGSVGFASVDLCSGKFYADSCEIGALAHRLSALCPTDVFLHSSVTAAARQLLPSDTRITEGPSIDATFNDEGAISFLSSIYSFDTASKKATRKLVETQILHEKVCDSSLRCVGAVLDFLIQSHGGVLPLLDRPLPFEKDRLKIDSETERSLEVFKSRSTRGAEFSLFSVINATITSAGRKELVSRLRAPFSNIGTIEKHQNLLRFFDEDRLLRDQVRDTLGSYCKGDTTRALQNLKLAHGGLWHIGLVHSELEGFAKLRHLLNKDAKFRSLMPIASDKEHEALAELTVFLKSLLPEDGYDSYSSLPKTIDKPGTLNPKCNEDLQEAFDDYQKVLQEKNDLIHQLRTKYFADANVKISLDTKKPFGSYVEIETSKKLFSPLPDSFKKVQTLAENSKKSVVRYRYADWTDLDTRISTHYNHYFETELNAFRQACEVLSSFRDDLSRISKLVAEIDVASSLAIQAEKLALCRPTLSNESILRIEQGRHLVVEQSLKKQLKIYQPNDCNLDASPHSELPASYFITAPNMGGKSTFLRQNALIIILAQIGSYVPASKATIGVVDQLFSRIGSSDDLTRDMSTFMVEMSESAFILSNATRRSFAIFDEIGRGTSYEDGVSLAYGICRYLNEHTQCRSLFATHFTELAERLGSERVQCHRGVIMERWDERVGRNVPLFTYRFEAGINKDSYGLFVAQTAGIPAKVVALAQEYKSSKFPKPPSPI